MIPTSFLKGVVHVDQKKRTTNHNKDTPSYDISYLASALGTRSEEPHEAPVLAKSKDEIANRFQSTIPQNILKSVKLDRAASAVLPPSSRHDALALSEALKMLLTSADDCKVEYDKDKSVIVALDMVLREVVRQSIPTCAERGLLIEDIRERYFTHASNLVRKRKDWEKEEEILNNSLCAKRTQLEEAGRELQRIETQVQQLKTENGRLGRLNMLMSMQKAREAVLHRAISMGSNEPIDRKMVVSAVVQASDELQRAQCFVAPTRPDVVKYLNFTNAATQTTTLSDMITKKKERHMKDESIQTNESIRENLRVVVHVAQQCDTPRVQSQSSQTYLPVTLNSVAVQTVASPSPPRSSRGGSRSAHLEGNLDVDVPVRALHVAVAELPWTTAKVRPPAWCNIVMIDAAAGAGNIPLSVAGANYFRNRFGLDRVMDAYIADFLKSLSKMAGDSRRAFTFVQMCQISSQMGVPNLEDEYTPATGLYSSLLAAMKRLIPRSSKDVFEGSQSAVDISTASSILESALAMHFNQPQVDQIKERVLAASMGHDEPRPWVVPQFCDPIGSADISKPTFATVDIDLLFQIAVFNFSSFESCYQKPV